VSENRDAWGQLPKCQPGDMPGDTAEEITRLKARNEKLEAVRIEARLVSSLLILDGTADTTKLDKLLKDCEGES